MLLGSRISWHKQWKSDLRSAREERLFITARLKGPRHEPVGPVSRPISAPRFRAWVLRQVAAVGARRQDFTPASALSMSAQGHLIVALNTQTVEGYPAYIYDLASTQLSSFDSRLIELDANTGEADYFATEAGYFARTILALPDNSVVKVGDSFEHKPIWWWMRPEGTTNEASVIHLSRYTQ